jgi:signal transduction protein with GAF and PtsI domain
MKYADTYSKLADFGRKLLDKKSLIEALPLIAKYAKEVIDADRCSIFIYDFRDKELWTTLADGVKRISIPSDQGLIGHTLKVKKPIVENNAYSNEHFLKEVDIKTGYKTENIITAPIFNSRREIIGILELLNKYGGFDDEDVRFMVFFTHYISGFLELTDIRLIENMENRNS